MRSNVWGTLFVSVVVGCGGGGSGKPDAMVDSPIDAPPVPEGTHYHYVVDHEFVPTNNNQAREFGLDLNGDSVVDNQLGMVLGVFAGMGFSTQADADHLV